MNSTPQLVELQRQLPGFAQNLHQHREVALIVCAVIFFFSLVLIFKGWRLHQLGEQLFGALLGALIGLIGAAAIRGLVFTSPFAFDALLIAVAIVLGLVGAGIGFKIARFDVTTLARTGLTIEGDGVHTVYGIIWSHALIGALFLAGSIFGAAGALDIIPQGREHFAVIAAAIVALVTGIYGAMRQTRAFISGGP